MTIEELKEEYEQKIDKLREEFNNKIAELQEEESNKRWKPKNGERYWAIDNDGGIFCTYWDDPSIIDNNRYKLGNIYKTEEEAKIAAEQLKVIAQLKQYADDEQEWNDNNNWHWCIEYDTIAECIRIARYHHIMGGVPFNLYFSSEKQTIKAINAIGEDKIKKYYFCI